MKLAGWAYFVVGLCLSAIILSYGLFQHYVPNMADKDLIAKNADAYRPLASTEEATKAKQRVTNAQKVVDTQGARWNEIVAVKTPPADVAEGGISLSEDAYHLTLDAPKFRNNVQRAVNAQLRHGGVHVVSGAQVAAPPTEPNHIVDGYFNYPAYAFPVCMFNFGTVTVQGTYNQIMENVRAWSQMPNYLAVTHNVAITGTSPKLTATYGLTVVALIRGQKVAPSLPGGGSTEGAGGGLGGGGGAPAPAGISSAGGGGTTMNANKAAFLQNGGPPKL